MMFFYNDNNTWGKSATRSSSQLGKKHGIPTLNDCAADVPPVENLWRFTKMGFDLVAFSGGKGIRGPQSAGLLLGRKDLIAAARLNGAPNSDSIGRGMKVNKEEMLGMLVALELFLNRDHARERRDFDTRGDDREGRAAVPGVKAEILVPEVANHVPHVRVSWDGPTSVPTRSSRRCATESLRSASARKRSPRHRRVDDAARRGRDRCTPSASGAGAEGMTACTTVAGHALTCRAISAAVANHTPGFDLM